MAAWKDVLNEKGLEVRDNQWAEGNWSSASGAQAVEKLFEQYPEMDSIFAANDQMALATMKVVTEKGLRIPEDIGIVGFDNIPESAYFWPPLTTVQQDQSNIARVAVEEMIKIIESGWQGLEPADPESIMLPPTLVIRQSTKRVKEKEGGVLA